MSRKGKTIFVISKEGGLYVQLAAVMSPLVALVDGLPMTFFGRGKTAYLSLDVAEAWIRKEMEFHSRERHTLILGVFKDLRQQERIAPEE